MLSNPYRVLAAFAGLCWRLPGSLAVKRESRLREKPRHRSAQLTFEGLEMRELPNGLLGLWGERLMVSPSATRSGNGEARPASSWRASGSGEDGRLQEVVFAARQSLVGQAANLTEAAAPRPPRTHSGDASSGKVLRGPAELDPLGELSLVAESPARHSFGLRRETGQASANATGSEKSGDYHNGVSFGSTFAPGRAPELGEMSRAVVTVATPAWTGGVPLDRLIAMMGALATPLARQGERSVGMAHSVQGTELAPLHVQGTQIVDDTGKPVLLRGVNFGSWLLLENSFFGAGFQDEKALWDTLQSRFGADGMAEVREAFRSAWITPADFQRVHDLGFNNVRVPFRYTVLTEDLNADQLGQLARGELDTGLLHWEWLDNAVNWAARAGVYVILDMHGLPGGQSTADHTGESNQNHYFDPNDPNYSFNHSLADQLWKAIAERYQGRSTVAAFDLMNEPMGAQGIDPINQAHDELAGAVWQADPDRVVILEDGYKGLAGLRRPVHPQGREDELVIFSRHVYPLFGNPPPDADENWVFNTYLPREFGADEAAQRSLTGPLYIGEWNVVLSHLGGGDAINRLLSQMDGREWSSGLWIYKQVGAGPVSQWWSIYRNQAPLDIPNFGSDTKEAILTKLQNVRTENLTRYNPIKDALALPDTWSSTDVGAVGWAGSATYNLRDKAWTVFAGGTGVGDGADQFHFVSRPANGAGALTAQVAALDETNPGTLAGVMYRASPAEDAPFVDVVATAENGLALQWRDEPGASIQEVDVADSAAPAWVKVVRREDGFSGYYSVDGQTWTQIGSVVAVDMGATAQAGLAVAAGDNGALTRASFTGVHLTANEQFLDRSVNLKAAVNGKYVTAEDAGVSPLIANRDAASLWEHFDLVDGGAGHLALRARVNGRYVTADDAGESPLIASQDAIGPWEQFDLDATYADGRYALRAAANDKYVTADNAGTAPLIANRDAASLWEWFDLQVI